MSSLLMPHADSHLEETGLLQLDQRGAREGCIGMLRQSANRQSCHERCQRSTTEYGVGSWTQTNDSVDYSVMRKNSTMHKFPAKVIQAMMKMILGCSTSLKVTTGPQSTEEKNQAR